MCILFKALFHGWNCTLKNAWTLAIIIIDTFLLQRVYQWWKLCFELTKGALFGLDELIIFTIFIVHGRELTPYKNAICARIALHGYYF